MHEYKLTSLARVNNRTQADGAARLRTATGTTKVDRRGLKGMENGG